MVKQEKQTQNETENPQQINRVDKVEINVGSGVSFWLVLAVLVLVGILICEMKELAVRVKSLEKRL